MSYKYDKIMMKSAKLWKNMSKCKRKKVGAVLEKDGRILITGYNGTISGMKCDICEEVIPSDDGEDCCNCNGFGYEDIPYYCEPIKCVVCDGKGKIEVKDKTADHTLHAEENILIFAAKEGISVNGCTLYITLSPCLKCARMIVQSGIKRVVYKEKYRDTRGIDFLKKHGIKVNQYKKLIKK